MDTKRGLTYSGKDTSQVVGKYGSEEEYIGLRKK
jgi:hypothetical protein